MNPFEDDDHDKHQQSSPLVIDNNLYNEEFTTTNEVTSMNTKHDKSIETLKQSNISTNNNESLLVNDKHTDISSSNPFDDNSLNDESYTIEVTKELINRGFSKQHAVIATANSKGEYEKAIEQLIASVFSSINVKDQKFKRYDISSLWTSPLSTRVSSWMENYSEDKKSSYTIYRIDISIREHNYNYSWSSYHRYSEFFEFFTKLEELSMKHYEGSKTLVQNVFPPKVILYFLDQDAKDKLKDLRKTELNAWLREIVMMPEFILVDGIRQQISQFLDVDNNLSRLKGSVSSKLSTP